MFKNLDSVAKILESQQLIENFEKKLIEKNEEIQNLKEKLKGITKNEFIKFDEQNAIDFFSNLLDDKDRKIKILEKEKEIFESREKEKNSENEKLKEELNYKFKEIEKKNIKNDHFTNLLSDKNQINYNEISLMNEKFIKETE